MRERKKMAAFRLPDATIDQLRRLAAIEQRSQAQIIEMLVSREVESTHGDIQRPDVRSER